jgi:hypothetical protein
MRETRELLQELIAHGEYLDRKLHSWKYNMESTLEALQREQDQKLQSAILYGHLAEVTYTAALASLK